MTDSSLRTPSPGRPGRRVADVQLRGPAPRRRVRVHWPASGDAAPALVVLFVDAQPATVAALVEPLVERAGAIVLSAAAEHVVAAHATVAWAADHAAELGADPGQLVLLGVGAGAALAERVAELALDEGWPPLRHVTLVWPQEPPGPALDQLVDALVTARPRRSA